MEEYRKEIELEDKERKTKIEKAQKLEKSWELIKLCQTYIKENSKTWEDDEALRNLKKKKKRKRWKD